MMPGFAINQKGTLEKVVDGRGSICAIAIKEIIAVDDASTGGTREILRDRGKS